MPDLSHQLQAALDQYKIAGASLSLLKDNKSESVAAGYANVPEQLAVTPSTVFQIGSITKAFTALLVARLVDEGKIGFDAPVRNYLPNLKIDNSSVPETLTVRSLLDHSCGFEGDFFADFGPDPRSLKTYVEACKDLRWLHWPGEMQSYNSAAYCIAGHLIEQVTGQYYNDALSGYILEPLRIERYCFYDHEIARYSSAVGHRWVTDKEAFEVSKALRLSHCMSASGASLTLSAPDLLRFGQLFLDHGYNQTQEQIVSKDGIQDMLAPRRFTPPQNKPLLMSWAILETSNGQLYATSGQTIDQNSLLIMSPDHQFAAAVLTNGSGAAMQIFQSVIAPYLQEQFDISIVQPGPSSGPDLSQNRSEVEDLSVFCGDYINQTKCRVFFEADVLKMSMVAKSTTGKGEEREDFDLQALGSNRFVLYQGDPSTPSGQLEFLLSNDDTGNPTFISMGNRLYKRV